MLDTRSNKLDLKGTVLNDKTLAVKEYFLDSFYYGTAYDSKSFSGLHQLMTNTTYNTVNEGSGTSTTVLNISNLRTAIDLITGFKPEIMVMSKVLRRGLSTYYDSVGDKLQNAPMFGQFVQLFDGIPIFVSDHIVNTETVASSAFGARTGGSGTSIFILTFAPDAVCGVQGSKGLVVEPLGTLETKDAQRWRIKWYCGLKFKNIRSAAKIDGITASGTVAA